MNFTVAAPSITPTVDGPEMRLTPKLESAGYVRDTQGDFILDAAGEKISDTGLDGTGPDGTFPSEFSARIPEE